MLFVGKRKSNMAKYKVIPGGVCAAKGFSASGVHAGFRANPNKLDLAIIKADVRCAAAGVYTTNKVYGAPIKVDRAHLVDGHAQAVLVNSGNANTCAANGVDLAKSAAPWWPSSWALQPRTFCRLPPALSASP